MSYEKRMKKPPNRRANLKLVRAAPPRIRDRDLQIFTRFPPEDVAAIAAGDLDANAVPAHVPQWERVDIDTDLMMHLSSKVRGPEETRIVYAIEAFILAHQAGLYPPKWVCDFLAERFAKWHADNGHTSLDKILGLTRGKRKAGAMKAALLAERNQMLALDVARFVELGAAISDGAEAVAARLEAEKGWDTSGHNLGNVGAERIEFIYRASSLATDRSRILEALKRSGIRKWLMRFPKLSIPKSLRSYTISVTKSPVL